LDREIWVGVPARRADGFGRRTAGRWVAPPAVAAVRFSGLRVVGRDSLERDSGRSWEFLGALMTPRGPSAGSRRVRPPATRTGLLGVVLLSFGRPGGPRRHAVWTRVRHRPVLRRHRPPADPALRTAARHLPDADHRLTPRPRRRLGPRRRPRRHHPLARLEELPAPSHLFWIGPPGDPPPHHHPRLPRNPPALTQPCHATTTQPRHDRNELSTNINHGP
jgi:hypothetical protein